MCQSIIDDRELAELEIRALQKKENLLENSMELLNQTHTPVQEFLLKKAENDKQREVQKNRLLKKYTVSEESETPDISKQEIVDMKYLKKAQKEMMSNIQKTQEMLESMP